MIIFHVAAISILSESFSNPNSQDQLPRLSCSLCQRLFEAGWSSCCCSTSAAAGWSSCCCSTSAAALPVAVIWPSCCSTSNSAVPLPLQPAARAVKKSRARAAARITGGTLRDAAAGVKGALRLSPSPRARHRPPPRLASPLQAVPPQPVAELGYAVPFGGTTTPSSTGCYGKSFARVLGAVFSSPTRSSSKPASESIRPPARHPSRFRDRATGSEGALLLPAPFAVGQPSKRADSPSSVRSAPVAR